ncbi:MAG: hypothetical protein KDD41_06985 [Flavobacteriales bacterium]|nr:hypothetical protein [Flavobacteriales bacterium]
MKKLIYLSSLGLGLGLFIYFYLFNFNSMSETKLLEVVLYWYTPLIFGLYGLTALRIAKTIGEKNNHAISHLFSGDDPLMLPMTIALFLVGGVIGVLFFFLPLSIFKVKRAHFDVYVSLAATAIFLVLLWLFFVLLWPSL